MDKFIPVDFGYCSDSDSDTDSASAFDAIATKQHSVPPRAAAAVSTGHQQLFTSPTRAIASQQMKQVVIAGFHPLVTQENVKQLLLRFVQSQLERDALESITLTKMSNQYGVKSNSVRVRLPSDMATRVSQAWENREITFSAQMGQSAEKTPLKQVLSVFVEQYSDHRVSVEPLQPMERPLPQQENGLPLRSADGATVLNVTGIPSNVSYTEIIEMFQQYGRIISSDIHRKKSHTGLSAPWRGTIAFSTEEEARNATFALNYKPFIVNPATGTTVYIGVALADEARLSAAKERSSAPIRQPVFQDPNANVESCTLYIAALPDTATETHVKDFFSTCGRVVSVALDSKPSRTGKVIMKRGTVIMSTPQEALLAATTLNQSLMPFNLGGNRIFVRQLSTFPSSSAQGGQPAASYGRRINLEGLPRNITEDTLMQQIRKHVGSPVQVKIRKDGSAVVFMSSINTRLLPLASKSSTR